MGGATFRCIPEELCDIGTDGKRLHYATLTPDDPRTSFIIDDKESGPFGKSRRSRSRSKLSTPARREDPNIAYFGQVWQKDLARKREDAEERQQTEKSPSRSASQYAQSQHAPSSALTVIDGNAVTTAAVAASNNPHREPMEVILYGYHPNNQHSAIKKYETISHGMICEDYPRDIDAHLTRYRTVAPHPVSRPLTTEELIKANRFAGGESWIKVTFDSHEAAALAVHYSPQEIDGHLVYAEYYKGAGPNEDRPIVDSRRYESTQQLRKSRAPRHATQTLGPAQSSSLSKLHDDGSRAASTLPRNFTTVAESRVSESPPTVSSTTASSATTTGFAATAATEFPAPSLQRSESSSRQAPSPARRRLLPETGRPALLPAELALLPQKPLSQRIAAKLPFADFWSGNLIGVHIPRLENGDFDYSGASIYWKACWWCDRILGTDLCGMRED
ncbi:MAG: hypothetical protein M1825_002585 [Sarcosagium campestre]|nr:MAG: hypothetical protein M1825_002585 [Sarcosagium campestre]